MTDSNVFAQQLRELGDAHKYEEQGKHFCDITRTTFEAVERVPQNKPLWAKDADYKYGINYAVTIKNPRGSFTFDYWGSIQDADMVAMALKAEARGQHCPEFYHVQDWLKKEYKPYKGSALRGKLAAHVRDVARPKAYEILTCLLPMSADTFEEFCSDYGYSSDSIAAERIYKACIEQDRNMRRLFTHAELEALQEIA